MIDIKLNEHSAEDVKEIEKFRAMGVLEDVIQMGYDNTQKSRSNDFSEVVKPTNADKIRLLSDEELAKFLVTFKNTFGTEYEGEMSCLDWLKDTE